MLLGSMKESDHLGPESHQVHERHIGQSHQHKSNTHRWIALRKERCVGSATANLPPLRGLPPFPHQHRALPITSETHFTELQVLYPMVPPLTMGRMFRGLNALHKRRARSTICLVTTFG